MSEAIVIQHVSKSFRWRGASIHALDAVNFSVAQGEIFGLLGPNGAGKSTLLNILMNLLLPDEGAVRILGKNPSQDRSVLEHMGFVAPDAEFHYALNARDILTFYAKSYGVPLAEREQRIAHLLDFFGLKNIADRRFHVLSTGERMRLRFAKALINNPKVLLLDEPTLGLDPDMAVHLRKEIQRINKELGVTILLTSHYMHEVEQLCSRIAFICQGKIIDLGTVQEVKLKHFVTYDVFITLAAVMDKRFLEKLGLRVHGNKCKITLKEEQDLSELLAKLHEQGYRVRDLKIKRPTLEDYFIKVTGEQA